MKYFKVILNSIFVFSSNFCLRKAEILIIFAQAEEFMAANNTFGTSYFLKLHEMDSTNANINYKVGIVICNQQPKNEAQLIFRLQ